MKKKKMTQILDGKKIAEEILKELKEKLNLLSLPPSPSLLPKPRLDIILVGSNPHSRLYTNIKKKRSEELGMICNIHHWKEDAGKGGIGESLSEEICQKIRELNPVSDGIIVQLPLPPHFDATTIVETIDPKKDVDGLTSFNLGKTAQGREEFAPAAPRGIIYLLEKYNLLFKGKEVTIVNHSNLIGKPLAMMFLRRGATVTICHEFTRNLAAHTRQADILVSGAGIPGLIKEEMVKEGAVVIDAGVAEKEGKIYGDVDFDKVKEKASWITPVPGGVGPMTVAMLLKNLVDNYTFKITTCLK